jgi:hypothetical protein
MFDTGARPALSPKRPSRGGRDRAGGAGGRGAALRRGEGSAGRRSHRDRGRRALRSDAPEPAQLASALPGAWDGRPRRPFQAPEELPAPHPRALGDPRDRAPKRTSPLGAQTPRLRARPQRRRPGPVSLEHLPDPGPIRARRAAGQEAQTLGLRAVGAGPPDGAVAARRHGGPPCRPLRREGPDRRGRSLSVLRPRSRDAPGHRPSGLRGLRPGASGLRGAPGRAHGQRTSVQRACRPIAT